MTDQSKSKANKTGKQKPRRTDATSRPVEHGSNPKLDVVQYDDQQYRSLVENLLPARLLRYNTELKRYVYMNASETLTGHTLEEWNRMGEKRRERTVHPDDRTTYTRLFNEWMDSGSSRTLLMEYRIRHKDGSYLWMENLLKKEFTSDGEIKARVEISRDISTRKEAELTLLKAREELEGKVEERTSYLQTEIQDLRTEIAELKSVDQSLRIRVESFQNLIWHSIDGILITSEEGTLVYANPRAAEITGYSLEELLNINLKELVGPDEHQNIMQRVEKRADRRRAPRQFAAEFIRKDRQTVALEVTAVRTFWHGKPVEVITMRDIRERRVLEGKRISSQVRKAVEQRYTFEGIVSKSPHILRSFEILPTIANSDSTVLIVGESGTGKELLAKAIHNLSPRRDGPLVIVNSGALPDSLIESELFGYKAGAFTDAKQDKPGRFLASRGGTIFLDEIGDISPAMQVKLLRVLQDRTFEPLGSNEKVSVDVRVIAATNQDLEKMVEEGTFRNDLFYRINVVQLQMPSLRERREDIPVLTEHFIGKFNQLFGKDITSISPGALSLLMNYDYPGNVRELENFIEHSFLLCRGDKILPEHLPSIFQREVMVPAPAPEAIPEAIIEGSSGFHPADAANKGKAEPSIQDYEADVSTQQSSAVPTIQDYEADASTQQSSAVPTIQDYEADASTQQSSAVPTIQEYEARIILAALERNGWNRSATAQELGIHRVTLNRKIHKFTLKLPNLDGRTHAKRNKLHQ